MKKSHYNHIIPYHAGYLLFNSISKQFIELSSQQKEQWVSFLKNIHHYSEQEEFKKVIDKFRQSGFIIADETDEFEEVKKKAIRAIERKRLLLTILPTYECNFACWYCIQHHKEEYMQKETLHAIRHFLAQYVLQNEIKEIEISWFGGEPLLCFDTHIREVCAFVKNFAEENHIPYANTITTNGYLITPPMLEIMKEYNFKVFQITLDGDKEHHNRIRNEKGAPSFDRILQNVLLILKSLPQALLCLRFNYTAQNILYYKKMVQDMNQVIPTEWRNKLPIFLRRVWQENEVISYRTIQNMTDEFARNGYDIFEYDMPKEYVTCEADRKHRYVIFHNGQVDKCENIPPEKASFCLTAEGGLKKSGVSLPLEGHSFQPEKPCMACTYLPVCLGPCKLALQDCKREGFRCVKTYQGLSLDERIIYYYENVVKRKR